MSTPLAFTRKPFTSSILLWVREDQPRRQGMDRWKGPHSQIISATPGFEEYRQIHLAETNPGLWPAVEGVETAIPADRRIDGIAEVTMQTVLSPLRGRKQTKLAYLDEVNLFRRTILYAGPPYSTRWYGVAEVGERTGARALVYVRKREGVGTGAFRKVLHDRLVPALAEHSGLTELRTQVFMPWRRGLWNTPNVAHDNPADRQFHASLLVGFADDDTMRGFFAGAAVREVSSRRSTPTKWSRRSRSSRTAPPCPDSRSDRPPRPWPPVRSGRQQRTRFACHRPAPVSGPGWAARGRPLRAGR